MGLAILDIGGDGSPTGIAFGTFRELKLRSCTVDALAVMKPWQPAMTGPAEPERLAHESSGGGLSLGQRKSMEGWAQRRR